MPNMLVSQPGATAKPAPLYQHLAAREVIGTSMHKRFLENAYERGCQMRLVLDALAKAQGDKHHFFVTMQTSDSRASVVAELLAVIIPSHTLIIGVVATSANPNLQERDAARTRQLAQLLPYHKGDVYVLSRGDAADLRLLASFGCSIDGQLSVSDRSTLGKLIDGRHVIVARPCHESVPLNILEPSWTDWLSGALKSLGSSLKLPAGTFRYQGAVVEIASAGAEDPQAAAGAGKVDQPSTPKTATAVEIYK